MPKLLSDDYEEEPLSIPESARKVYTQPYDISLATLNGQWESKLLSLPEIQRDYVWDNKKASKLIESLLLNIPVPALYFVETNDAKHEIIDGHQRVRSIVRFMNNEFKLTGLDILNELAGKSYFQLPEKEKRYIETRTLRAIVISPDSHPDMKYEVFERLNSGAVTLNAQELRNSLFRGELNELIKQLELNTKFRQLIGTEKPRKRMADRELITRFLAFYEQLSLYRPPLKRFLNNFMESSSGLDAEGLDRRQRLFKHTVATCDKLFGQGSFRLSDNSGAPIEPAVNRALFDTHMLCASCTRLTTPAKLSKLRKNLTTLYKNDDFLDAIRRATGDKSRTTRRLSLMKGAFERSGIDLHESFDGMRADWLSAL